MTGIFKFCCLGMVAFFLIIWPAPCTAEVAAADQGALIGRQMDRLDLRELESYLRRIDQEMQGRLEGGSLKGILESIRRGRIELSLSGVFKSLINCFFREILTHSFLLGKLLVLGSVLAVLEHLQNSFEEAAVARLAHGIGVLGLLAVALSSFTMALDTGRSAIDTMVGFMQSLVPVLLTLMTALGGLTSVALLHPVIFVSLNILGTLSGSVLFPLIFCAAILGIVNQLSEHYQISRLADLLKDGGVLLLGLFLTVFIGLLAIQGVAGAVTDGIGLRTAKYLTGAFVPVVGGALSDAVESVLGCSLFLKNAIGLVGTLSLACLCLLPILKILSAAVVYRLAAALMQPLGAQKLGDALNLLGGYLFLVFGAVAAVGLMFFIALAIVVGLGNFTVMLR